MDSFVSTNHNIAHQNRCFRTSSSSPQDHIIQKKYKGIRRRKWGKWVSEIRVPGTQQRVWLGSYTTPEAAAVAHDMAFYCLRGHSSPENFNFPLTLPSSFRNDMSPKSIQRAASDAGMAVDAQTQTKKLPYDHDHCNTGESSSGLCSVVGENFTKYTNSEVLMRRSWPFVNDETLQETELWEGGGSDRGHLICCGKCEVMNEGREGEGLSISVDDYL